MTLFNRFLLKQNANRCATKFHLADFLHNEIAQIIIQTIDDYKENFSNSLEIGAKNGFLGKQLKSEKLLQIDLSEKMVQKNHLNLAMDDENLCFENETFDLVVSNLNLHFVNDIPKNLMQIKNILKPKGQVILSFFGEENLKELKEVFFKTEEKIYGKISPRISPNIDIKSAGMLLQKAGLNDVVCEKHSFEVSYSSLKKLFLDLRNMGQGNILNGKSRKFMTKGFLLDLKNNYQNLHSQDGELIATFEVIIVRACK
ncbi:MAG: SAM-dependent methyltransferase [Lentimonas sp.]